MDAHHESADPARIELSREQMREFGYRVVDLLTEHFAAATQSPVGAKADPEEIWERFAAAPGDEPRNVMQLLTRIEREVLPNNLHVDHPRFFAFVPGPNNFVSAMSDALAAGFNVFNGTWLGGSAAAAMEMAVIRWFCQWCELPGSAGGLFVSGGSAANETALVAARHALLQDRVDRAIVYFSDQTHSSVERALRVIGFAPEQIRILPGDSAFRLPLDTLREKIAVDRAAGLWPFCVVANAGTTNTGAVDPLNEIADICGAEKMWMHVDGAYGAATMLCERGRAELTGLNRCDSLSLDPHKWLFQSFECGCVLVRDAELLKSAFRITPDYLRDVHRHVAEKNFCDYGIQLTRSFRSLKVWLSLQTFGLAAFRRAIERGFELAEFAEAELRKRGWEILAPAQMAIVCFRIGGDDAAQTRMVEALLRDGYAFLTSTTLHGRIALRFCTINPRTTEADIVGTIDRIERLAG
ncbi:MAG: pyridoxal phosphate-dependent decarboxylase family protein [Chthoniobacterales bacterium]